MGEEFVKVIDDAYKRLITWRKNQFKLLSAKAPKLFDPHTAEGPLKSLLSVSVHPLVGIFIRYGSLVYDFCMMIDNWNI